MRLIFGWFVNDQWRAVDVRLVREDLTPAEVTLAIHHERNAHIVRQTD